MSKRQQRTIGAIIKIDLGDGYHSYARILNKSNYAFYDIRVKEDISDLNTIAKKPILFTLAVYDDVVTKGRWLKIGKLPLEENLQLLPMKFIQDAQNPERFELYDSNTGETKSASKEECKDLECAAVWEASHVEERIRDHYEGRPNIWVEKMKVK
ncbi:MAG: immunity 26/phosphotriesterase HocA family protein [Candidatus Izemoplasmataceae bacterium]